MSLRRCARLYSGAMSRQDIMARQRTLDLIERPIGGFSEQSLGMRYDPERYLQLHPNQETAMNIRNQMDELAIMIEKMNARQDSGNKVIIMAATMFLTSSLAYSLYQFNDVNTTLNACLPSLFRVLDFSLARQVVCGLARFDLLPVDFASEDPYLIRNITFGSRHPQTRPMRVCVPIGLGAGIDVNCDGPAAFIKQGFGFIEVGPVKLDPTPAVSESLIQVLPRAVISASNRSERSDGLTTVSNKLCDYIEHSRPNDLLSRNSVTGISIIINSPSDIHRLCTDDSFSRLFQVADYICLDVQSVSESSEIVRIINSLKFSASSNFSIPPIFLKISLSQSFPPSPAVVEAIAESPYIVGVSVVGSGVIANDAHRFPTLTTAGYDLLVSGEIIRDKAVEAVSNWYTLLKPFDKHIIASGGVACGKDALNLIESGASMISIYSGYVCNGPQIARQIKTQLSVQLMNKGYFNLEETIGGQYLVSKRREIAMKRRKKF